MKDRVTHKKLLELLEYNQDSGVFKRKLTVRQYKAGTEAGCFTKAGYVVICIDRKNYMAHVLAWFYVFGEWPTCQVDHRNGIGTDNRFSNLRDVSTAINAQNKHRARSDSTVGLLGVVKNRNKFTARIKVGGKRTNIGTFGTAEQAHNEYVKAKRLLHEGCTI